MRPSIEQLIRSLKYDFKDRTLLEAALTHRSVRGLNNERLEFLGDAILNFIIAEAIYNIHPYAKEGELSRLRSSLVKGETLAILAQEFQVGLYLHLGIGELKSGGAQRESILADTMEAIIAAIYLDSDFETCRKHIRSWYQDRLQQLSPGKNLKDPKTSLQEYLQAHKLPLPHYSIQGIEGEAHDQFFYVQCQVDGVSHITVGKGKSRRKAEQDSAKEFLNFMINEYTAPSRGHVEIGVSKGEKR